MSLFSGPPESRPPNAGTGLVAREELRPRAPMAGGRTQVVVEEVARWMSGPAAWLAA